MIRLLIILALCEKLVQVNAIKISDLMPTDKNVTGVL